MENENDNWEIKDRHYFLANNRNPLTLRMSSRHTNRHPLLWFDNENGHQRELRYATNQKSPFVDEQNGTATLGHIVFKDGTLTVPKEAQNLQKLLSLYHPQLNKMYKEHDSVVEAEDDLDHFLLEADAMNAAIGMEIDHAEAILCVTLLL